MHGLGDVVNAPAVASARFDFLIAPSLFRRYHYNVADSRLAQHVEKGNEDGLSISSVASCQNLWALIMDAGTGFTAQVYELAHVFLPKVGCLARRTASSATGLVLS